MLKSLCLWFLIFVAAIMFRTPLLKEHKINEEDASQEHRLNLHIQIHRDCKRKKNIKLWYYQFNGSDTSNRKRGFPWEGKKICMVIEIYWSGVEKLAIKTPFWQYYKMPTLAAYLLLCPDPQFGMQMSPSITLRSLLRYSLSLQFQHTVLLNYFLIK